MPARLSRYGSGGMSGGQVSGAFWLNEVLPMLVERLVTYSLPAAAALPRLPAHRYPTRRKHPAQRRHTTSSSRLRGFICGKSGWLTALP